MLRIVLACCVVAAAAAAAPLTVNSHQEFVDEHGRVRVFRGVNAVYKLKPFHPTFGAFDHLTSLNAEDIESMQKWGFNAVRMGVMWEAVETSRDQYNTTYLGIMRQLSDRLGAAGIWTLVDAHQDSMNRRFCGEGMPDYVIQPNASAKPFPWPVAKPIPNGPDGYPNLTDCQKTTFALFNLAEQEASAWKTLYESADLHAQFGKFWHQVAAAFSTSPTVLGYELLNEPWFGDAYTNPLNVIREEQVDKKYLLPMYQAAYAQIRAVDDSHIVAYEPVVTELYLDEDTGFGPGGPGGAAATNLTALATHHYCFGQNATGDFPPFPYALCSDFLLKYTWGVAQRAKAKTQGGWLVTEYGAVGNHTDSAETITTLLNLADASMASTLYWTFKSFKDITTQNSATESLWNDDGSVQTIKLKALTRTYAQAVAAMPGTSAMHFDPESGAFELTFVTNPAVTEPTLVYYSTEYHYPKGANITVSPQPAVVTHVNDYTVAVRWTQASAVPAKITIANNVQ